jgi:hypothetical protein
MSWPGNTAEPPFDRLRTGRRLFWLWFSEVLGVHAVKALLALDFDSLSANGTKDFTRVMHRRCGARVGHLVSYTPSLRCSGASSAMKRKAG